MSRLYYLLFESLLKPVKHLSLSTLFVLYHAPSTHPGKLPLNNFTTLSPRQAYVPFFPHSWVLKKLPEESLC